VERAAATTLAKPGWFMAASAASDRVSVVAALLPEVPEPVAVAVPEAPFA